jgi:hypothetical protein
MPGYQLEEEDSLFCSEPQQQEFVALISAKMEKSPAKLEEKEKETQSLLSAFTRSTEEH